MRTFLYLTFCLLMPSVVRAEDRSGVRPETLSLPSGPGSIEGLGASFDPNPNTGMSSYSVPIQLPPGVAAFVPELALRYSSGAGNGELGIGWTLGLPVVERSTDHGLPTYGAADIITLRGMGGGSEELAKLTDSSYRFRIEGAFARGRQREDGSWEFRNRSGVRFRFGQGNARVADGSWVFAWHLTEQEDTFGNLIRYEYEPDETGRPYLVRVVYNDFSTAVRNEVVLRWETRADALTSHLAGFPVTLGQRLERIEVRHGGETIRTYSLRYEELLGLSRLVSVQMVGRDGKTGVPPVTFEYASFAPDTATVVQMGDGPTRGVGGEGEITDVDGDALPDLLITDASVDGGRYRWFPNLGGVSFGPSRVMDDSPSVWLSNAGVHLADMDGNGEADIVAKLSSQADGFRFYPSVGGQFADGVTVTPNPSFGFEDPDLRLLDLNHDRLTDWARTDPSSGELTVSFNQGAGKFTNATNLGRLDTKELLSFSRGLRIAEMNGDGLADLVMARSGAVRVWAGQGNGRFAPAQALSDAPSLTDQEQAGLQVRDLNGDGLSDLVSVGLHEVRYWINLAGISFVEGMKLQTPPHSSKAAVRLADMNGNGTTDIVWIDPEGAIAWQYQDVLSSGTPGLLTKIDNGLGKVVAIEYVGMAELRVWETTSRYERAARNPIGQTVLRAVTVSDSLGNEMRTEYRYAGGYYHPAAREFRGFALSEVRELGDMTQPTLVTSRVFDLGLQNEATKGMLRSSERRDDTGHVFDRVVNQFQLRDLEIAADGRPVVNAFVRQADTSIFEGTTEPKTLRSEWDHDAYGNVVLEAQYGEVCGDDVTCGDDERVVVRTYAMNLGSWVVDRVASERIQDVDGARAAEVRNYYDGKSFEGLALGQVARGALSRVESWLTGGTFAPDQRNEHDAWGNVVVTLDSRGARHEREYDNESHTALRAERVFVDEMRSLQWQVTDLDLAFGAARRVVGPNGDVTQYDYDALGRVTMIAEPGDDPTYPTRLFAYSPESPLSTIREELREQSGKPGTILTIKQTDGLGRTRAIAKEGADEGVWLLSDIGTFNARGLTSFAALPLARSSNEVPSREELTGAEVYHDGIGREVRRVEADRATSSIEYLPLARVVSDANDNDPSSHHHDTPNRYRADGLGRVREVFERDAQRELRTGAYDYDVRENLVGFEDALGHRRQYGYDGHGKLVDIQDPNAGHWTQEWSPAGDLLKRTGPDLSYVRYERDAIGRVTEERHALRGAAEITAVRQEYDAACEQGDAFKNLVGQLACAHDAAGQVFFGYTARGMLSTRTRRFEGGAEYETWTEFDSANRPTKRGYPDRTYLPYTYDARGLVHSMGAIVSDIEWTPAGQLSRAKLGNGIAIAREYDARQNLSELNAKRGEEVVAGLHYALDSAARITSVKDLRALVEPALDLSAEYSFDHRYRLVGAVDKIGATRWAYDDVTNVTSVSSDYADDFLNVTNKYEADGEGPDRLTRFGSERIQYDVAGRVIEDEERRFDWDAKGRLARVTRGSVVEEYVYGFDDKRTLKTTRDGGKIETVRYIDHDVEERGGQLQRYVFLADQRIARLDGDSVQSPQATSTCAIGLHSSRRAPLIWIALGVALAAARRNNASARRSARIARSHSPETRT